ncbi:MAG TPA: ABC transporter permease [Dehalococcoidia bacterium]|nr:ABC transporter permease [Dehalococcoidia bacterium]
MRAYIIRRLLLVPFMLLAMSVLLFYLLQVQPGDAALLKIGATGSCQECLDKLRADLGLDRPAIIQYFDWLGDIVRGDFGRTLGTDDSIGAEIKSALPITMMLAVLTIILTLIIGIPVGVLSAVKQGTFLDYFLRVFTIAGLSVPSFWLATLLVLLPVIWWNWTPLVRGFVEVQDDPIQHLRIMFWPALTLAVSSAAYVARLVRSSMLEILYSDYVRTARAKGLREGTVVVRHVLRGALVTVLTLAGIQFGVVLGGAVLIEQIFAVPGMGSISLQAVNKRDYREVMAVTMVFAAMFIFITLIVDILYAYVDPRIRY